MFLVSTFLIIIAAFMIRFVILPFFREDIACRIYGIPQDAIILSIDTLRDPSFYDSAPDNMRIEGKYKKTLFTLNNIQGSDLRNKHLKSGDTISVLVWNSSVTTLQQGYYLWIMKILGMIFCLGLVFSILGLFVFVLALLIKYRLIDRTKCPKCKKYFGRKIIRTSYGSSEIVDFGGSAVVSTPRTNYCICKYCKHQWVQD